MRGRRRRIFLLPASVSVASFVVSLTYAFCNSIGQDKRPRASLFLNLSAWFTFQPDRDGQTGVAKGVFYLFLIPLKHSNHKVRGAGLKKYQLISPPPGGRGLN